jgi:amino acid permease
MEYAGIFIFGLVITAIVFAACGLIVYGIVTERQERELLEAEQEADRLAAGDATAS